MPTMLIGTFHCTSYLGWVLSSSRCQRPSTLTVLAWWWVTLMWPLFQGCWCFRRCWWARRRRSTSWWSASSFRWVHPSALGWGHHRPSRFPWSKSWHGIWCRQGHPSLGAWLSLIGSIWHCVHWCWWHGWGGWLLDWLCRQSWRQRSKCRPRLRNCWMRSHWLYCPAVRQRCRRWWRWTLWRTWCLRQRLRHACIGQWTIWGHRAIGYWLGYWQLALITRLSPLDIWSKWEPYFSKY